MEWHEKIQKEIKGVFLTVPHEFSVLRKKWHQKNAVEEFSAEMLDLPHFLLILFFAGLLASLGLLRGNEAVVIGAMIITPLALPFAGIALGIATLRLNLFLRALLWSILGTGMLFATAAFLGGLFDDGARTASFLSRGASLTAADIGIALAAGGVAAIALSSNRHYSRLSGAAIALSLAPPLSVAALDFAHGRTEVFGNALLLFGINVAGIIGMSLLVFLLIGFHRDDDEK